MESSPDNAMLDRALQNTRDSPIDMLDEYMRDILNYRCWASFVAWQQVDTKIKHDGSKQAAEKRSAYAAKVATFCMQNRTPWLAMTSNRDVSKDINCRTIEFHTELIKTALADFVDVGPEMIKSLETILGALSTSIEQGSASEDDRRTIVCQRYEYIEEMDRIHSYVRVISFVISDAMKNVHRAKRSSDGTMSCQIEYNEFDAQFNYKQWEEMQAQIDEEQKTVMREFVVKQTINCEV